MYGHRSFVSTPFPQNCATPLYIASQNGHSDVVNILVRNGADINLADEVWRLQSTTHTGSSRCAVHS